MLSDQGCLSSKSDLGWKDVIKRYGFLAVLMVI